tara:strand:+ start:540 stop:2255 length:1716 start_codon:yes stop_codon:yes gene_type:complete
MEKNLTNRDWCLSPEEEKVFKPTTQAVANANGESTLAQVEVLQKSFMDNMVADNETNPVVKAVKKYGNAFDVNLNLINKSVANSPYVSNYALLEVRIANGPITQFEFAQFITEFNYSPVSANFSANQNTPKFLKELDDFYRGGFAKSVMGGFCSVLPNVFAAIGGFFNIIGQIQGLIGDALSFIAKIRNIEDPIKALFEAIKVRALIEAIKEKITKTVMGAIEKIQSAIENFNIADVIGNVVNKIERAIVSSVNDLRDKITRTFSPENLATIRDKITGMIDYAVGLFDNPSLEEIMFLMMRICGFAAGVEAIINGTKAPLDRIAEEYRRTRDVIASVSGRTTSEVIRNGGIRFTDEERAARSQEALELWTRPPGGIETTSLPAIELEDERTQPPSIVPDATISELDELPSWQEIQGGGHPVFNPVGGWVYNQWPASYPARYTGRPILGALGWTGGRYVTETKIKMLRLHKRMKILHPNSRAFGITSLYRNQEYQTYLIEVQNTRGVATNSQHLLGRAVDLSMAGTTQQYRTDLVNEARRLGFTSFGFYRRSNFIHMDHRALSVARTWGTPW